MPNKKKETVVLHVKYSLALFGVQFHEIFVKNHFFSCRKDRTGRARRIKRDKANMSSKGIAGLSTQTM